MILWLQGDLCLNSLIPSILSSESRHSGNIQIISLFPSSFLHQGDQCPSMRRNMQYQGIFHIHVHPLKISEYFTVINYSVTIDNRSRLTALFDWLVAEFRCIARLHCLAQMHLSIRNYCTLVSGASCRLLVLLSLFPVNLRHISGWMATR